MTDPWRQHAGETLLMNFHFHKPLQQMNFALKHGTHNLKNCTRPCNNMYHCHSKILYCSGQAVGARMTLLEVGVVGIIVKKLQH